MFSSGYYYSDFVLYRDVRVGERGVEGLVGEVNYDLSKNSCMKLTFAEGAPNVGANLKRELPTKNAAELRPVTGHSFNMHCYPSFTFLNKI